MKTCFKCGKHQPYSEFYKHPAMADGHLGKCKSCAKKDANLRRASDLERVRLYDRERGLLPHRRASVRGTHARYQDEEPWRLREYSKRYRFSNPEKYRAQTAVNNALRRGSIVRERCAICGNVQAQAHHEDYSKPLSVIWLCARHHGERHRQINQEMREKKST